MSHSPLEVLALVGVAALESVKAAMPKMLWGLTIPHVPSADVAIIGGRFPDTDFSLLIARKGDSATIFIEDGRSSPTLCQESGADWRDVSKLGEATRQRIVAALNGFAQDELENVPPQMTHAQACLLREILAP